MIRKVRIPLKYKFVFVITFLLLITMGFYLSYAINIFKEDKSADIYSITLSNSVSVAERTRLLINEDLILFDFLEKENILSSAKLSSLMATHEDILAIECYDQNQNYYSSLNGKMALSENSLFELNEATGASSIIKKITFRKLRLESSEIKGMSSHFSVYKLLSNNFKCGMHLSFEKLMPLMNESIAYGTYILSDSGKMFLKLNDNFKLSNYEKLVSDKTIANGIQGVKKFEENNTAIVRAFAKISHLGLIAITEIPEEKAFMASSLLIQKSFYYGVLLLSIAVIAGILFTRRMTTSLQTLFEATTELSKGNFQVNPIVKGNDEIGALTDSFVDMKDKILDFMEEMKEKHRIENEVQVAKLVQDSFFPKNSIKTNFFQLTGFYEPASECSGDWWGYFEQGNKLTIIACDATGHGVPAALITAQAHSCITTLKLESLKDYISPKLILDRLNRVISSLDSEILMTTFVLEIDSDTKKIKYANASHMSPYLLRKIDGEYSKEGLHVLMGNNGARVGQKSISKYSETEFDIQEDDRIVLFTDGILEATHEGKAYGQRNFLKSLFKNCQFDSIVMADGVISDFKKYNDRNILEDDITLICVTINSIDRAIRNFSEIEDKSKLLKSDDTIFSCLDNNENINILNKYLQFNHLIGLNGLRQSVEMQLVENSKRLLTNDFLYSIKIEIDKTINLFTNKSIKESIEIMITEFQDQLTGSVKEESLRLISDELLSNAFYHSDTTQSVKRGSEVILIPDQAITYSVSSTEDYFIISVTGPGGFHSKTNILESIQRGFMERTAIDGDAGAGLGLYICFLQVNQFWLINKLNNEGQIICILEKFNRNKQSKERVTSFHYIDMSKGDL